METNSCKWPTLWAEWIVKHVAVTVITDIFCCSMRRNIDSTMSGHCVFIFSLQLKVCSYSCLPSDEYAWKYSGYLKSSFDVRILSELSQWLPQKCLWCTHCCAVSVFNLQYDEEAACWPCVELHCECRIKNAEYRFRARRSCFRVVTVMSRVLIS